MKKVLISAGEPSGDLYGGMLIHELRELIDAEFYGMGGQKMRGEGCHILYDCLDLSVVGFSEILSKLSRLRKARRILNRFMLDEDPSLMVLIDYPGFNLGLAALAKSKAIPVVYYVSPQVWAWGNWRVKSIERYVDHLICILPFQKYGLSEEKNLIGFLPGSRREEVRRILPIMMDVKEKLGQSLDSQFVLILYPGVSDEVRQILGRNAADMKIVESEKHEAIQYSDLLLCTSGTVTLESLILGTPMLVLYKMSLVSWLIGKVLVKIPYIGLVNIIAGRELAKEFVQFDAKPKKIVEGTLELLAVRDRVKDELKCVSRELGQRGAARKAAAVVQQVLTRCS
jgi:lipid-A-disaccharide synthase